MSKLTDEEIKKIASTPAAVVGSYVHTFARAIEAAATEPLLLRIAHLEATASANYGRGHADAHSMLSERIAELEQRNSDLHEDVQRFKKHALNEKAARLELERQLEEARKDAERYRHLRSHCLPAGHGSITIFLDDRRGTGDRAKPLHLEDLDAAVDENMKGQQ